jgi:hypothetical protein
MLIRFKEQTELEVVNSYDEEHDEVDSDNETFQPGVEYDVCLLGGDDDFIDIQFGDGSCAYGVPKDILEITEEKE